MAKRKNYKAEGFRPTANPEQHKWKLLIARSNAAVPHTQRHHKGTRAHKKQREINQQRED